MGNNVTTHVYISIISLLFNYMCVIGLALINLSLNELNFVKLNLVRIGFIVTWFIFKNLYVISDFDIINII